MKDFKQFVQLARCIDAMDVDWSKSKYTKNDVIKGFYVELEHGTEMPKTNITDNDIEITVKIALRHLEEDKDYYHKLMDAGL